MMTLRIALLAALTAAAFPAAAPQEAPGAPAPRLSRQQLASIGLQVALDRAGFSPGEIDAARGPNTLRALAAFGRARGVAGTLGDAGTLERLGAYVQHPIVEYVLTDEDLTGPFAGTIPADLMEQSRLPALTYRTAIEQLGEKFHVSPELLTRMNSSVSWAAGQRVLVPDVEPFSVPGAGARPANGGRVPGGVVTVSARDRSLIVTDDAGSVVFFAPVTIGGTHDPLPVGEWKVKGIIHSPVFNYNPDLFWDADPSHSKARIAPGPNNPVGVVWIDLDKEHYGMHGTPEPSRVGHTQSHGCIRLTNWDAARLAALVSLGQRVILR